MPYHLLSNILKANNMSVFFLPDNSKSIFYFYEDENKPNEIKTISYHLDSSGKIIGKWKKNGTVKQLMGAIKSVAIGNSKIISESEFQKITAIK